MVWEAAPGLLLSSLLVALIQAVVPVGQIYITRGLVDAATRTIQYGPSYLGIAYLWVLVQVTFLALGKVVTVVDRLISSRLNYRVGAEIETRISVKAVRLPLAFFDQSASLDKIQRATQGNANRALQIVNSGIKILSGVISLISISVLLVSYHWALLIALIVSVIPSLISNQKAGKWRYGQMVHQTEWNRMIGYFSSLLRGRAAAKEVRAFDLGEYLLARWGELYWKTAKEQMVLERRALWILLGSDLVGIVALNGSAGVIMWLGAQQLLTIGTYVALVQTLTSTQTQMSNISQALAGIYENALFVRELTHFLGLPDRTQDQEKHEPFPVPLTQGITVQDLTFFYPGNDRPALQDITFSVRKGERVAIVGDNGAGKSTLVKCLMGLYDSSSGSIHYDQSDIGNIDKSDMSHRVSAIFQDYVHYYLTLRENVGLGNIHRMHDDAALQAAAVQGGVVDFLPGLPQGLNTTLGPDFYHGVELSHGQWQKVALSRALLRDAEVLFLDEPTASVDPSSEAALFERFYQETEGKTAFLISHRMGTCRFADKILVLKGGRLIEQGTHAELMQAGGEYAHMVRLQAHWSPVAADAPREEIRA